MRKRCREERGVGYGMRVHPGWAAPSSWTWILTLLSKATGVEEPGGEVAREGRLGLGRWALGQSLRSDGGQVYSCFGLAECFIGYRISAGVGAVG